MTKKQASMRAAALAAFIYLRRFQVNTEVDNMKRTLIFAVCLAIFGCSQAGITSFQECAAAGNPVMESHPRQCMADGQVFVEAADSKQLCESAGGKYDTDFGECTGISAGVCESIGGRFDMCASACRHDPGAQVCTMQCVQVCYINQDIPLEAPTCTEEQKQAEVCTMEYNPVCGDDGVTYSNACEACAGGKVDAYIPGEC